MVVIADASKRSKRWARFPLPVEVVRFGLTATRNMIDGAGRRRRLRGRDQAAHAADGKPFVTDGGNFILDCAFGRIAEPEELDEALKLIPGVVENGLFLGIADLAIMAGPDGISYVGSETASERAHGAGEHGQA